MRGEMICKLSSFWLYTLDCNESINGNDPNLTNSYVTARLVDPAMYYTPCLTQLKDSAQLMLAPSDRGQLCNRMGDIMISMV